MSKAPQLRDTFAQRKPLKGNNLENGYITLTQPHVDRLWSNLTRWYSVAPWKMQNYQNSPTVESKMADGSQIFNIWAHISLEWLKLDTSNFVCASTMRSTYDSMQKSRSKGTWPSLGDLDSNLWTPEYLLNG